MKLWISDKKFLPRYLLFCLLFSLTVMTVAFLGIWFMDQESEAEVINQPSKAETTIVVIDAGHGGEDGGAVGANGIYEKDLNLSIAKALDEMLRACGVQTVMTRSEDILLYDRNSDYKGQKKVQDLAARRKIAERYENAVFVSIHMNAFPDAQYSGLQVYYSKNNPTSSLLAETVQAMVKNTLLPSNNRAIKSAGSNIYLLDRLTCPAVLIECGFLSNPEECERLSEEAYRLKLARVLCASIMEYLSQSEKNPVPDT